MNHLNFYCIKQIDYIFPCGCTVIDHRRRHSVYRTTVTYFFVPLYFSRTFSYGFFLNLAIDYLNLMKRFNAKEKNRALPDSFLK